MSELFQAFAITNNELEKTILSKAVQQLKLGKNSNTFDLFPFYSVLVTAANGFWNKNNDIFTVGEVFPARHSPAHKPLNLLHNCNKIIGHIVDNIAVNAEDLKPIPEDTEEGDLPYKLHIITCSVIYKYWDDLKTQAEINNIIDGICNGEWAVSMECLFKAFDYGLMDAKGEQKIIPRNNETSILTKQLRQYGGSGKIHNYSIGRILRQITFSGEGLVKNPANPDSIISDDLNIFTKSNDDYQVYTNLDSNIIGENNMAEKTEASKDVSVEDHPLYKNLLDKHDRLTKDHADLMARCEDMKGKLDHIHEHTMAEEKAKKDKLEKEVADLKEALASKEKEYNDMDEDCKAAKASVQTLQGNNDAMKATLDAYKKAERSRDRTQALMDVDKSLSVEDAAKTVANFNDMSDTVFNAMLTTVANYVKKAPVEVTPEKVMNTGANTVETDVKYGVTTIDSTKSTAEAIKAWWGSGKKENLTK